MRDIREVGGLAALAVAHEPRYSRGGTRRAVHQQEGREAGMTQRLCSAILLTLAAMAAVGCTHVTDRYQASAPVEAFRG